jgi:excisionase family DNA binding protein
MSKLLSKKVLDSEILEEVLKYYRVRREDLAISDDEFVDWECFSHPSLELHDCNCRARLPGGHACKSCNHVVGRSCAVSCDLQSFCLGVFAWRIGIGGEDFKEALRNNLYKLNAEELYAEVIKKFSEGDVPSDNPEDLDTLVEEESEENDMDMDFEVQNNTEENSMEYVKQEMTELTVPTDVEVTQTQDQEDLLTIKEAAALYGCTYANIYNYVNAGSLPSVMKGRRKFVQKDELLKFKDRPRSRKSKKE